MYSFNNDDWLSQIIDNKKNLSAAYLKLSSAFNIINHKILLKN